jgi:hypothetical protein
MKIIGRSDGGYIVEITTAEMERIMGNRGEWPNYGEEVNLAEFFDVLDKVRNFESNRIHFAIKRTQDMLKSLEEIEHSLNAMLLFDKLSRPENENS